MLYRGLLASVAMLALPAVASAQVVTMTSSVTLGFSSSSIDGIGPDVDLTGMSLDFNSDIMIGSNVTVAFDFGLAQTSVDIAGAPFDIQIDLMSLAIEPAYHFGNGGYAGVYYRMGDLDVSISVIPITFGVDSHSFGIFGGYENGPLWVEGFVGSSDTDPSIGGVDVMDYGIAAAYEISPNFEVFGSIARTDIDLGGGFDIDLTNFSLGAEYGFGNGLSVYGSVGRTDIGTPIPVSIDVSDMTLGLAYDLGQSGAPISLNFEVSRTSLDVGPLPSIDVNRFALGVTIPIGGGSSQPLNSNTSAARGDYRSVVAQLVNSF